MNNKRAVFTVILSLSLITSTTSVSQAKMSPTETSNQFSRIEQPLSLKILVTLGGLGLIGAEVWWFLLSQTKSKQATTNKGIQEVTIVVDGGYTPDRVKVNQGQPVRLKFLRKDSNSCLEKVILPDFHQSLELPINQVRSVEFIPNKSGVYTFHCGMNMFRGVLEVHDTNIPKSHNSKQPHSVAS